MVDRFRCCVHSIVDCCYTAHVTQCISQMASRSSLSVYLASLVTASGVTSVCSRHGKPFVDVICSDCENVMCPDCVAEHASAHPLHILGPAAPYISSIRRKLEDAAVAHVDGCWIGPDGTCTGTAEGLLQADLRMKSAAAPIVSCARHKARAVEAALAELAVNETRALAQLARRHADLIAEAQKVYDECAAEIRAEAAARCTALNAARSVAESALHGATEVVEGLLKVGECSRSRAELLTNSHPFPCRPPPYSAILTSSRTRKRSFASQQIPVRQSWRCQCYLPQAHFSVSRSAPNS